MAEHADEDALIAAAHRGDEAAFCVLVDRHQASVRRFLMARCPRLDLVEEAVQDVFVIVWQRLDRFRGEGTFLHWVLGIARNALLRLLRDERRRRQEHHPLDLLVAEDCSAESEREDDRWQRLAACLERLGPRARKLIRARYADGRSLKQMAQAYRKPTGAIAREIQRLVAGIRGCVEREMSP